MKRIVVLISGKQGSGKTSTADRLAEILSHLPNTFVFREKFAGAIYEMHDKCQEVLKKYAPQFSKPKDGDLLQLIGTEWGRMKLGPNVWCELTKGKVEHQFAQYSGSKYHRVVCIIDDCRFINELETFPDALRVRLECSEETRKTRTMGWRENSSHASETGLDQAVLDGRFDMVLSTDRNGVDCTGIATLIDSKIQRASWTERRR